MARLRVEGRWARITRPRTPPLFRTPEPFDARWQRGAVVRGLYLACCPETAWAEWLRATAEDGVPPDARLPRDLWRLDVALDGVADLTAEGAIEAEGLPPMRPTQAQWPAYQAVGERLWREGAAGILAPSAAHEGHRVLCVFREVETVPGVRPVGRPVTHLAIPGIPRGLRT